jgi:hypothetical protein
MELLIGTTGAALVLLGFIMIEIKKWDGETIWFDLANFVGSLLLFIYAFLGNVYPFMALNAIWTIFSLVDVIKYFIRKNLENTEQLN